MNSLSPPKLQNYLGVERGVGWKTSGGERRRQSTKVLFNVNIQSSLGAVKVIMSPENTIWELMKAAIGIYVTEKRRPLLGSSDPHRFEIHYSQFSLECLKPEEKLMDLGSRSFFLCSKPGCAEN